MRRRLVDEVLRLRPDAGDAATLIASGRVRVDGRVVTNPRSMVDAASSMVVVPERALRGERKLRSALDAFAVHVAGKVALDVGAATGGFTRALLRAGATRVYAVDAGHGQLLGSLRQDARVVNLETTNVSALDRQLIPEAIELVVVDVSYLSLSAAVAELARVELAAGAGLVGLVKPMFELRLASAPTDAASLDEAIALAAAGAVAAGWTVVRTIHSPVTGARGAVEGWVHAVRSSS